MNFDKVDSNQSHKSTGFLEGKDKLLYYSKYSQVNTKSTSNIDKKSMSSRITDDFLNNEENIERKSVENEENEGKKIKKYKSKIGYVKLGFFEVTNVNPIARYNFYTERYNEEINCFDEIILKTIPCHKIISIMLDFYIVYMRILLGIFLILLSSITENFHPKSYNTFFQYYNINGSKNSSSWTYDNRNNRIFLFFSFLSLILNTIIFFHFFWLIFIPIFLILILLCYSYYFVRENKLKIKKNFYRNMIFDEEIDNSNKLNDYITIIPGGIEEYLGCSFYTILLFLYRKRDNTVPQQFMLYGNNYKKDKHLIRNMLFIHLTSIGLIGVLGFIANII